MKTRKKSLRSIKIKGLRRSWLIHTLTVVCVLGLVCALAVTAAFSAYYYSSMESDMRYRARFTTKFLSDFFSKEDQDYYQSCITYVNTFADSNEIMSHHCPKNE